MTVTYGFYDSVSSDRVYNALQMGQMFDGILQDGIFALLDDALEVIPYSGMTVQVGAGRAFFNHTWLLNDAGLNVVVPTAHPTLNRIDIVYLETNSNSAVRANKIDILQGTAASSPVPPTLATGPEQYQYALAHIYVGAGVTEILEANITDKRGIDTDFAVSGLYSFIEPGSVDTEHLATGAVTSTKISDGAVANNDIRDSAAMSVIGRAGATAGDVADIVAGTDGYLLRRSGTAIGFGQVVAGGIADGAITSGKLGANSVIAGKIADGAVDVTASLANDIVDDTKVGNRVPQLYRRKGGSSTVWATYGDTNYTPGAVRIQCGVAMTAGGQKSISFPVAFSEAPIVIVSPVDAGNNYKSYSVTVSSPTASSVLIQTTECGSPVNIPVNWIAIGPE